MSQYIQKGVQNMDKAIFSKNLKELREKENLTKTALADILNCDQPKVSKMENAEHSTLPTVHNLIDISKHFKVSIDWLIGNELETKVNNDEESTLSEELIHLFALIDSSVMRIGGAKITEYIDVPLYHPDHKNATTEEIVKAIAPCLLTEHVDVANIMKQYKSLIDANVDSEVIDIWKQGVVEKNRNKLKKYKFRTEREYALHLCTEMLEECKVFNNYYGDGYRYYFDDLSQHWFGENREIISKNFPYIYDQLDSFDNEAVMHFLQMQKVPQNDNGGFVIIPDEKLPFY